MSNEYLRVFSPLLAITVNLLFQVFFYRKLKAPLLKSLVMGFLAGFSFFIILEINGGITAFFLLDLLEYIALGYCYFHFVNLGETGRRIRILYELYDSPEGLTIDEILKRYDSTVIIEKRVKRLVDNKQITFIDGRYYIRNSMMKYISNFIFWTKLLFAEGGADRPRIRKLIPITGILIYFIANFAMARSLDFESYIFCPFRYEGLLFFRNAASAPTPAFFFIRDWSTSFVSAQHPLLYFHNLDLVHFFAGFIQHVFFHSREALFAISLIVSLSGLWLFWKFSSRQFPNLIGIMAFILILVPPRAFGIAPQNLFISLSLLALTWHFKLLKNVFDSGYKIRPFLIETFFCFFLASIIETNQALLMALVFIFFVIFSPYLPEDKGGLFRNRLLSVAASILPIVMLRAIQLITVYAFGFLDKYKIDLAYTSKLKVNSSIGLVESIKFYAENGITYFGQGQPQRIISNLKAVNGYFFDNFGRSIWVFTMLFALVIIFLNKKSRDGIRFFSFYLIFFTLASYLLVFLTGDAILKISLSQFGILDYPLFYIVCFILLAPYSFLSYFKRHNTEAFDKTVAKTLTVFIAMVFVFYVRGPILKTRIERFSYKEALAMVEKDSDIITNYEPSVVAIEAKGRANMSWFDSKPSSCQLLASDKLIKMYKVIPGEKAIDTGAVTPKYIFLAFFPPYGSSKKNETIERHCVFSVPHTVLFEDKYYGLYKING